MSKKPKLNIFPKENLQYFLVLKRFQGDRVIHKSLQGKIKRYYKKVS